MQKYNYYTVIPTIYCTVVVYSYKTPHKCSVSTHNDFPIHMFCFMLFPRDAYHNPLPKTRTKVMNMFQNCWVK